MKSFESLKAHIEIFHVRKFQQICDECGELFPLKAYLKLHKKSHDTRDTRIICRLCPSILNNERALNIHISRIHKSLPGNCPHYPKVSPNQHALVMHIKSMHYYKLHKCHICDREYKSATLLRVSANEFRSRHTLFE